ncbi:MAG: acetyl-CoA synthase subunit gamma [Deltaproteobacteria bacterium]|nr:acetyl-CoA synthase subunit gamma [Deltaproteobacteria bacterium]
MKPLPTRSGCCRAPNNNCCSSDAKDAPLVSTSLSFKDRLGGWKVRWGIGRVNYQVEPGLYAVGKPDGDSPVLVSANYKLTFDTLRKNLVGLDCWLLILDTKGVNVWCAAGKKTFGTSELINRLEAVKLSERVRHRKLILPQLGAPGVSAPEIARRAGFSVIYGPVRASDLKAFISSGYQATKEMRTVSFTLRDRLVLTPVELVQAAKKSLSVFGVLFLLNLFAAKPFDVNDFAVCAGTIFIGAVLTPVLLPFIPGRAFAFKGWLLGLCWATLAVGVLGWFAPGRRLFAAGYLLALPAVAAYLAMNFTGSSTYTSPSGVLKEMKIALPLIVISAIVGSALTIIGHLMG